MAIPSSSLTPVGAVGYKTTLRILQDKTTKRGSPCGSISIYSILIQFSFSEALPTWATIEYMYREYISLQ